MSPLTMEDNVRTYFANMPWRGRVLSLALIVGLLCGVVAVLYEMVMDFTIELVWEGGYEVFIEQFPSAPPYLYIMLVCCTLVYALFHLLCSSPSPRFHSLFYALFLSFPLLCFPSLKGI